MEASVHLNLQHEPPRTMDSVEPHARLFERPQIVFGNDNYGRFPCGLYEDGARREGQLSKNPLASLAQTTTSAASTSRYSFSYSSGSSRGSSRYSGYADSALQRLTLSDASDPVSSLRNSSSAASKLFPRHVQANLSLPSRTHRHGARSSRTPLASSETLSLCCLRRF